SHACALRIYTHTGRLQRQRPGVWPSLGASEPGGRWHPAGCHRSPGRCPRRQDLWRRRPQRSTLCAPPCRRRACETVTGLTSECVAYLLATGGGVGSGKRPRDTPRGQPTYRKSLCLGAQSRQGDQAVSRYFCNEHCLISVRGADTLSLSARGAEGRMDTPENHEAPIRVNFGSGLHAAAGRPVDASAYERYLGRWSRLFVPAVLAAAEVANGDRVLDVATGPRAAALLAPSLVR